MPAFQGLWRKSQHAYLLAGFSYAGLKSLTDTAEIRLHLKVVAEAIPCATLTTS